MRKSKVVVLSAVFASAMVACNNEKDEWISGKDGGRAKDTVIRNQPYRYYHGAWFPLYHGGINPGRYNGASFHEISSPSYHPSMGTRSGGFGSSSHFSSGS